LNIKKNYLNYVGMKGCLILFGEAFRLGGQGTRNRGSDESYEGQIKAATSHMEFMKDLKSKGVNMEVYISSYNTKFNDTLLKIYENTLIGHTFYDDLVGQHGLIHTALDTISSGTYDFTDTYDFILIMRIDLFLKDRFMEIFNPNWDKILFPSICWKSWCKIGIHPRVNDMMIYIPKKYFNYVGNIIYNSWHNGHNQWGNLIENKNLTYDDLDTMLNTFHDSDSAKDFNPIYYIVNRPESTVHHTPGDIFDKYNFKNDEA